MDTADGGWAVIPRYLMQDPSVPSEVKLVYVALTSHGSGEGPIATGTLSLETGLSIEAVEQATNWLVENGHLS